MCCSIKKKKQAREALELKTVSNKKATRQKMVFRYICRFKNLSVRTVSVDRFLLSPEHPQSSSVMDIEIKVGGIFFLAVIANLAKLH